MIKLSSEITLVAVQSVKGHICFPGGCNAINVPYGDVPLMRVYFWPSNPRQGVFFRV